MVGLLLLAAAVLLLWPAMRPVHVEGFSASIVAIGLHLAQDSVRDFQPFAPFNTDYFGLTKLGAVYGVAALSPLVGGDGAMRIEMLAGAALCVGGSAYLIRRWTGVPWLASFAILLLIPGFSESFFFFHDGVPAAGLMIAALATWAWRPTWPVAVIAGLLIGYAVAIRTDTVLVAAAAMPLMALQARPFRQAVVLTAGAAGVAIALLAGLFALVHTTPFDAVRAGALAVKLWDRPLDVLRHLAVVIWFLGAPWFVLLALSVPTLARERRWLRLALLVGVPLFVNVMLLGRVWEMRQLLVLTPFLGALVADGLKVVLADLQGGRHIRRMLIAVALFAWLFSPPLAVVVADGPHAFSGRVAGLGLWSAWQQSVRDDFRQIDDVIASTPPNGRLVVLTEGWNEDRYLHLELVKQGFRRAPLAAPCDAIGEAMTANGRTVIALSLQQTFLPKNSPLTAQRLERFATPCLEAIRPDRSILLVSGERLETLYNEAGRPRVTETKATRFDRMVPVPLDGEGLASLDRGYRAEPPPPRRLPSAEEAIAMTRSQTAFSR